MRIRPQVEADYPAVVDLINGLYSEGLTVANYSEQQVKRQVSPPFTVLVAEVDGQVVGRAAGGLDPSLPTGDMICSVMVQPAMEGRGIGSALFTRLIDFYQEHQPTRLRATIHDEPLRRRTWAEKRGFAPRFHILESRLDLTTWEPAGLIDHVAAAQAKGFRFLSFDALRSPENDTRLWQFYQALLRDTPDGAEWRETPRDEWIDWAFQGPSAWPEGCLLALDASGAWVGLTFMRKYTDDSGDGHIYMTGISPQARGLGLSTALKVEAARRAKEQGMKGLTTINEAENERIRAVNRRMGFARTNGYYRMIRPWSAER